MEKKFSIAESDILEILNSKNAKQTLRDIFKDIHPFAIFSLIESMREDTIARIIMLLSFPLGAEVFEYFDDNKKEIIFKKLSRKQMIELIEEMSADERVDFIKSLDKKLVDSIMPSIAQVERNEIKKLIKYKEGTAGSIMTTEYATLKSNLTVKQGISTLKLIAPDRETIYSIYITDDNRKLLGWLTLEQLILADENAKIKDIMHKDIISVKIDTDQEEVSKIIADYDLMTVPVVDEENRLVGIITVDDIVDIVNEEATEDFLRHASVQGELDYLKQNPFILAKQRIIWLLLLVFVGLISGFILQLKREILESVIALTFFLPLLNGTAGNAGTQSSTLIIRGLATGELEMKDVWLILIKEIGTGIIVGIVLGTATFLRALFINNDFKLAITVGTSMIAVVFTASILGGLLPIIFKKMKLDPALMSAPFITTIVDVLTVYIYLTLAAFIFHI